MIKDYVKENEISVVFGGEAGQGIDTITAIISKIYKNCGFNVCLTKEYMSRIRGGTNSSEVRISSNRVDSYTNSIDLLFALTFDTINHLQNRISDNTLIFLDSTNNSSELAQNKNIIEVNLSETAKKVGGKIFENTVASGILFGLITIDINIAEQVLKTFLKDKPEAIINKNIEALNEGVKIGQKLKEENNIQIKINNSRLPGNELLLSGTEAIVMGCLAGGCNFISSYPMSPATGVLVELASVADKFGIIVEQAEDEISAMNMGIGAWYAGAGAMVTTSGGGFDLMTEGLSLAGITESPMVIHIGQRPGPATGLPTRTEQGDLELALYSGHGEFPRIIYAPGTLEECYELSKLAFINADKYQMPVFILTDQYSLERIYNVPMFDISDEIINQDIVKTEKDYKRYQFTDNGISPRGIPGYKDGLVCVDGDEHDEDGHLTEDVNLRVKMIDKRRKKTELVMQNSILPELIGNVDYKTLIIAWGSTKNSIIEAMQLCGRTDIALLHFKQVYPLPTETKTFLEKAEKTITIENNTKDSLARLIRTEFCINIEQKILKYDGVPFSADKLAEELKIL